MVSGCPGGLGGSLKHFTKRRIAPPLLRPLDTYPSDILNKSEYGRGKPIFYFIPDMFAGLQALQVDNTDEMLRDRGVQRNSRRRGD